MRRKCFSNQQPAVSGQSEWTWRDLFARYELSGGAEHILRSVRMMPSESLSENKDERFGRKRPNVADYIGYCQKFNHETRSTDEIMKELREGEE